LNFASSASRSTTSTRTADIDDIVRQIKEAKGKLKNLVGTVVAWLGYLHDKYARFFPRRTKFKAMEEIDEKAVARANLRLGYDAETGFFGAAVKAGDRELKVTEYDKVIAIMQNGVFRIMARRRRPCSRARSPISTSSPGQGPAADGDLPRQGTHPLGQRVHIQAFIHDKEYELIKERAGRLE